MPYNNEFNSISKRYTSVTETEAAKKILFENFDITEEQYKNAPLLSTLEEIDAYFAKNNLSTCNAIVAESSGSVIQPLKYLAEGEDIV